MFKTDLIWDLHVSAFIMKLTCWWNYFTRKLCFVRIQIWTASSCGDFKWKSELSIGFAEEISPTSKPGTYQDSSDTLIDPDTFSSQGEVQWKLQSDSFGAISEDFDTCLQTWFWSRIEGKQSSRLDKWPCNMGVPFMFAYWSISKCIISQQHPTVNWFRDISSGY